MKFEDRRDAGRRLAAELVLGGYRAEQPIVLALPRGGVAVGYEVARALGAPLDVWVVRKIGVLGFEELGLGAIAEGGQVYVSRDVVSSAGVPAEVISEAAEREAAKVERRVRSFRGDRPRPDLRDRTAILVDDGIATGGTVRAAIAAVRAEHAKKIVLAVPVAPAESVEAFRMEVDDLVCLLAPADLHAIGLWYENFRQLSDDEVIELLDRARQEQEQRAH